MSAPRLAGVGGIFIDDIVLPDGTTYMGRLGGGVVHAMMGAALWGERPGIIALAGQDLPADIDDFLSQHLDTSGLHRLAIPQIRAWQIFEHDGTRRELYRVAETQPFIDGAQPRHLPADYANTRSYYLLQGFAGLRRWRSAVQGLILWEPLQQIMTPGNLEAFRTVLPLADIVSPNLQEVQQLYGHHPAEQLAAALLRDGANRVILRMGAAGSLVARPGTSWSIPAAPVTSIIDQTGAGNTYNGAFLAGIMQGKNEYEAGIMGAVAAAFCLEYIGVLNPSRILRETLDSRYRALLQAR